MTTLDFDKPVFISKPGTALLHMADGEVRPFAYGEQVPVDELAEHQRDSLHRIADNRARAESPDSQRVQDAHLRAAEVGQPNATVGQVPGNYSELDENAAVALVRSKDRDPEGQAAILLYERVNKNREKVFDAATDEANDIARERYANLSDKVGGKPDVEPVSEPESDVATEAEAQAEKPKPRGGRTRSQQPAEQTDEPALPPPASTE